MRGICSRSNGNKMDVGTKGESLAPCIARPTPENVRRTPDLHAGFHRHHLKTGERSHSARASLCARFHSTLGEFGEQFQANLPAMSRSWPELNVMDQYMIERRDAREKVVMSLRGTRRPE